MRLKSCLKLSAAIVAILGASFLAFVYAVSEWKFNRVYSKPAVQVDSTFERDPKSGERMAKIVGCWAGCHGTRGEGGIEEVPGLWSVTAPALGSVIQNYSDEELFRLILHGIKRDGRSAIGMPSYSFWSLGDADIGNIIHFLRQQPRVPATDPIKQIPFASRMAFLRGDWWLSADWIDKTRPRWGNMPRTTAFERGRFLAAIVCAECHGSDFLGDPLQGGPSLAILTLYAKAEFERLMKTGLSRAGTPVQGMAWLPDVEFTDRDIADLYAFLAQ